MIKSLIKLQTLTPKINHKLSRSLTATKTPTASLKSLHMAGQNTPKNLRSRRRMIKLTRSSLRLASPVFANNDTISNFLRSPRRM